MLGDQAVSRVLGSCNFFDFIMRVPEELFDGVPEERAGDQMERYVKNKMKESQLPGNDFTDQAALRATGVMKLLMRSWGLVETFYVDRPQKPAEKWLRLSPFGRKAFDVALGQFLDGAD